MRCRPTVNVDRLKPFIERSGSAGPRRPGRAPGFVSDLELLPNRRWVRGVARFQARWRGRTSADDEWLREEELVHCRDNARPRWRSGCRGPQSPCGTLATAHPSSTPLPPVAASRRPPPCRRRLPPALSASAPPTLCRRPTPASATPPPAAPPLVVAPAGFRLPTAAEVATGPALLGRTALY